MFVCNSASRRALTGTAVVAALTFGSVAGAGTASAHVHADADDPIRGEYAVVTFRVPNESDRGSPTTKLTVYLPALTSVSTQAISGWANSVERDDAAGTVRSVTWAANPGGGIEADQFGLFAVSVKLPEADAVTFPVTQVYADGTTVRWDQPASATGVEPEHPAPSLALLPPDQGPLDRSRPWHERPFAALANAPTGERELRPDVVARALAGGAVLLAAIGIGISVVSRRG